MSGESPQLEPPLSAEAIEAIRAELATGTGSRGRRIGEKFLMAALGAIPWVGGLMAALSEIPGEEAADKRNDLRTQWIQEHQRKLEQLGKTLAEIVARFEAFGAGVDQRIQSPEYLALVRQSFRVWDSAETEEKRSLAANVIANSAGTRACSDDVVRLFISWLDDYHEAHLAVIREIHQNPGTTRFDIWSSIYGSLPREDSAEADLFKMLIRDLSTGGVVRQVRDTNEAGQFIRRRAPKRRGPGSATLKSAFDDEEQYVLTDLGKQFVHYSLIGEVRRLGESTG